MDNTKRDPTPNEVRASGADLEAAKPDACFKHNMLVRASAREQIGGVLIRTYVDRGTRIRRWVLNVRKAAQVWLLITKRWLSPLPPH
jgi:hypothetical protein